MCLSPGFLVSPKCGAASVPSANDRLVANAVLYGRRCDPDARRMLLSTLNMELSVGALCFVRGRGSPSANPLDAYFSIGIPVLSSG